MTSVHLWISCVGLLPSWGYEMSITRAPRPESNFYILDKRISEDRRLSWGARGLLIFLLGKPDSWNVSVSYLREETASTAKPTGRDGVYGLLDELISAGYVIRSQERIESGGFSSNAYVVREAPLPEKPYTAKPDPANPTLVSIESKQELKETNVREPQAAHKGKEIPFEKIRMIYQEVCGSVMKPAAKLTSQRESNIRACWNHSENGVKVFRSADFWRTYFQHCMLNAHWRGENGPWKASLEFLTRKSTMEPTVEELMLKLGVAYESA